MFSNNDKPQSVLFLLFYRSLTHEEHFIKDLRDTFFLNQFIVMFIIVETSYLSYSSYKQSLPHQPLCISLSLSLEVKKSSKALFHMGKLKAKALPLL